MLFDTPEADRILSTLQIFPPDNPWHEDISERPVHPDSAAIVADIGAEKPLGFNLDMNFVIVPPDQPKRARADHEVSGRIGSGTVPDPENAPIENWPLARNEDARRAAEAGEHARAPAAAWHGRPAPDRRGPRTRVGCTSSGRRGGPTPAGKRRRPARSI